MNPNRPLLIQVGQLFLHEQLNEYMIVTRNDRGQISFEGSGFRGQLEDFAFIEKFQPVDPENVDQAEIEYLLTMCPPGTEALIGFVGE